MTRPSLALVALCAAVAPAADPPRPPTGRPPGGDRTAEAAVPPPLDKSPADDRAIFDFYMSLFGPPLTGPEKDPARGPGSVERPPPATNAPPSASAAPWGKLSAADVVALTKAGLSVDAVQRQISQTKSTFGLSARDLIDLKRAGVPDDLIGYMQLNPDESLKPTTAPVSAADPGPPVTPAAYAPLPGPVVSPSPVSPVVGKWYREYPPFVMELDVTPGKLTAALHAAPGKGRVKIVTTADYTVTPDNTAYGVITGGDVELSDGATPADARGLAPLCDVAGVVGQPFAFQVRADGNALSVRDGRCLGLGGRDLMMFTGRFVPLAGPLPKPQPVVEQTDATGSPLPNPRYADTVSPPNLPPLAVPTAPSGGPPPAIPVPARPAEPMPPVSPTEQQATAVLPAGEPRPQGRGPADPAPGPANPLVGAWYREVGSVVVELAATPTRLTITYHTTVSESSVTPRFPGRVVATADYAVTRDGVVHGVVTGVDVEGQADWPKGFADKVGGLFRDANSVVDQPFSFRVRDEGGALSVRDLRTAAAINPLALIVNAGRYKATVDGRVPKPPAADPAPVAAPPPPIPFGQATVPPPPAPVVPPAGRPATVTADVVDVWNKVMAADYPALPLAPLPTPPAAIEAAPVPRVVEEEIVCTEGRQLGAAPDEVVEVAPEPRAVNANVRNLPLTPDRVHGGI